jgi:exodeoxyribonuclease VII small subunit
MPKSAPEAKTPPAPSFETAMTRLEQLVEEMDAANLPLQDLITRYEEGVELVKVCEERLKEAGRRIEIITRNAAGKTVAAPFEPGESPSPEARPDVSLF